MKIDFKYLILFSLVNFSLAVQADCKKPVDPKKVMLFIDTNYSDLEIATTEKAACERGERLVIVPKNYKEYTPYIDAYTEKRKAFDSCSRKQGQKCESEQQAASKAMQRLTQFTAKQKHIESATKEALDEIKKSGAKLKNLSISGHDGGGDFGGSKGAMSRYQLEELMKEYEEINDVSSILLLGCYTGVPKEVYAWKNIFPNAKLIAGYDGSAPLSDKPYGHDYISDILLKEKQLLKVADEKKLYGVAKQIIQSLPQINSALYLQCDDGTKQGEFYYSSADKVQGFITMGMSECEAKKIEMQELLDTYNKYDSGELEVPKDTVNGDLRQLYNRARRLEHCIEVNEIDPNVKGIFNLLFYEGVKKNFANYYKEDLKTAEEIMTHFDFNEFEKGFEKDAKDDETRMESLRTEIAEMEKNPAELIEKENQKLKELEVVLNKYKEDPAYKPFIDNSADIQKLSKEENVIFQEVLALSAKMRGHKELIDSYSKRMPQIINSKKAALRITEESATEKRVAFNNVKENYTQGKRIWFPTDENLKKKSRKETLQNLHLMHSLLRLPGLPRKQNDVMNWVKNITSDHLQYYQNPFSWHEFTGHTESPGNQQRLSDFVDLGGN